MRYPALLSSIAMLCLTTAGCQELGDDAVIGGEQSPVEPQIPVAPEDPLYLVYTNIFNPDFTATALVHVVTTVDEDTELDSSEGLVVDTDYVDLSVPSVNPERAFYASFRSEPKIQRWVVEADGSFTMTGEMGLSALGVTNAASLQDGLTFVSPEKAYFLDFTSLTAVVFNPTEMTITNTIPIDGLAEEGLPVHAYYKHVDNGRIVVATNHSTDEGWVSLGKLLVIDTRDDSVAYDEQTQCGALSWTAKDPSGNMYFVSHSSHAPPAEVGIGDPFPPCMVRVRSGADEFDDSYYVNLRELIGGPAGALMQGVNGVAYTFGYSEDAPPLTIETLDSAFGPVWDYYSFELGNEAATLARVPNREPGAAFAVSGTIDIDGQGEVSYVTEISPDLSSTTVFDTRDPSRWKRLAEVPGFLYGVFRLR